MHILFGKLGKMCVFALTLSCLVFASVSAEAQMMGGPMGNRPPAPMMQQRQDQQDWWRGRDAWRANQRRFFGNVVLQPRRGESEASFRNRLMAQCNTQWNRCASRCNMARNPNMRAVCVSNCNNALHECRMGW